MKKFALVLALVGVTGLAACSSQKATYRPAPNSGGGGATYTGPSTPPPPPPAQPMACGKGKCG